MGIGLLTLSRSLTLEGVILENIQFIDILNGELLGIYIQTIENSSCLV
jgi:hypothetical protein